MLYHGRLFRSQDKTKLLSGQSRQRKNIYQGDKTGEKIKDHKYKFDPGRDRREGYKKRASDKSEALSTQSRDRTGMEVNPLVFETSASTNSAIWASCFLKTMQRYVFFLNMQILD